MSPHITTNEGAVARRETGHSQIARRVLRQQPRPPVYCRPRRQARERAGTQSVSGEAAGPVPGALTEWHAMTPGEQMTAWAQLRAFVTWLTDRYELAVEEKRVQLC